jgi:hypothetical protein
MKTIAPVKRSLAPVQRAQPVAHPTPKARAVSKAAAAALSVSVLAKCSASCKMINPAALQGWRCRLKVEAAKEKPAKDGKEDELSHGGRHDGPGLTSNRREKDQDGNAGLHDRLQQGTSPDTRAADPAPGRKTGRANATAAKSSPDLF